MKEEKAYKLLAIQENISNTKAKELIDTGLVYSKGEKILIARSLMHVKTKFTIKSMEKISKIFEDENKLVVNKPAHLISEDLAKKMNLSLLHRLDKQTSGVLILSKNEAWRNLAIEEFKALNVEKIYYAIVCGKFAQSMEINSPILSKKTSHGAFSKIDAKGKTAFSFVEPVLIEGKYSLVKVTIKTGRTHQIRVHLASVGYPILGEMKYAKQPASRLMLHSFKTSLLGQSFKANLPSEFANYGFNL